MRMPLRLLGACAVIAGFQFPALGQSAPGPTQEGQDGMSLLVRFLTGTHETILQEERLGSYVPMKVRFAQVWPETVAKGERWLYEEVVETDPKERVVLQQMLRFTEAGGVIHMVAHDLPGNPGRFAGEWRREKPFASLAPRRLKARPGCDVEFIQQGIVMFNGGQRTPACRGRVRGSHERIEMYVTASSVRLWQVELDDSDRVVAGPPSPLELRRISGTPD
ncbi:MAG: CpcT/CpeT family chromophore lyase [Usitatibacter sp.]